MSFVGLIIVNELKCISVRDLPAGSEWPVTKEQPAGQAYSGR